MKQIKRKKLSGALVQALGAGVAVSVIVTAAHAQQAQRIEKIEVTGSNIKRVDQETVAPVEIITREQIERTGQATVAEVLRNIPANTGGSFGESFTNSFAPGAAGISLRGLGQKATLVLINGRRVSGYGFAQNIQDTFVDLNSIPTAAVERVEILKDGASAVYGSDAIAGVVNIILRKDFRGVELNGQVGQFEGKNDWRFTATGGLGDLARDRYSIFGTFDYYKRDLLQLSDTDFGATRDMRHVAGGRNHRSLTAAGTWRQLTATNTLTTNHRATTDCPGTVLTGPQALDAGLIAGPLGNNGFNLPDNTFCSYDFNNQFTALPKTERLGFIGRANFEFSPTMSGYIDLGLSRIDSYQTFQSTFFAGTTGLSQTAAGLRPFGYNVNFAPGVAGNPFSSNARYSGVMQGMGTRDTDITSDTIRVLGGLNFTFGRWALDTAIGFSRNEIDSYGLNNLTLSGTSAAFGVPSGPQPPVPVSTSSTYNLDRFTSNSDAVRSSMLTDFLRSATSELKFVDVKATAEFGRLPGGPMGVAIGAEYREEKLIDRADEALRTGDILGRGLVSTDGQRDNTAIYAEVALPVTRAVEIQVAGRHDRYSDYGNSTTPKAGIKFKATDSLLLRANWGKGFRAPTLPEISPSIATFFTSVIDPLNERIVQVSGSFGGNPDLEPEKSESATFGIIFEPNQNLSIGLNYYRIEWKNIVVGNCCQDIVNEGDPARVIRDPLTNEIVTVLGFYENVAQTKTNGLDLEARYRMSTAMGRVTARASVSYVHSFKEEGEEFAGRNDGTNTIPRVRGQFAFDWDYRGLSATFATNYIRGYQQGLLPGSFSTVQDPRFQNQVYPERIPSYVTYDFFAKYTLTKNLSISGALVNAHNRLPPYDPGFSGTSLYDFSIYDVRGRQIRLGLTWKM